MKLEEFLKCEHDIDMNTSMTRLYCLRCGQDKNVIDYVKNLQKENESKDDLIREAVKIFEPHTYMLMGKYPEIIWLEKAKECLAKLGER